MQSYPLVNYPSKSSHRHTFSYLHPQVHKMYQSVVKNWSCFLNWMITDLSLRCQSVKNPASIYGRGRCRLCSSSRGICKLLLNFVNARWAVFRCFHDSVFLNSISDNGYSSRCSCQCWDRHPQLLQRLDAACGAICLVKKVSRILQQISYLFEICVPHSICWAHHYMCII